VHEATSTGTQENATAAEPASPASISRLFAAIQVFLVCGIPTQLLVFAAVLGSGAPMAADGTKLTADASRISLEFFAMTSLFDTALIAILIRVFLGMSGESSRDVFIGRRRTTAEFLVGLLLIPICLVVVVVVVNLVTTWLPGLHDVPTNPYEAYMQTPFGAGLFIVVVILAGGVREEIQRAFVLHRFEQRLGGAWLGLVVWSAAFGLFHLPQGKDAALAVGLLGLIWGVVYIRRRSAVAPIVSHAGFDVAEILLKGFAGQ
jgi:membrane protease YdiL (CAAX protease family)